MNTCIRSISWGKLPENNDFYSKITQASITDDDYEHAKQVWQMFYMETLGDYHDLYLTCDVLLLSDVFENFRNTSMEYYTLDPCHFYSTPHFTWNAMLKFTDQRLELLTDIDMHLFIEEGLRGGVAMISNRYAKANNPLIADQYDSSKQTTWIQYYDCNNLHGTAIVEPLPYGGFRWLEQNEIDTLKIEEIPDNADIGYILQVDLDYPESLHNTHSDYPLAPVREAPTRTSGKKLLTTLKLKEKYVLHYRNLKLYLQLGLKMTKMHKVIQFRQSPWLRPYIEYNTKRRSMARNNFEKDYFKLFNNAVYGKSLENVRNRIDFRLITDERTLDRVIAKPRVKRWFIYSENVVGVSLQKAEIYLNRPVYIGFTVLDVSKLIMYTFHYKYMLARYGECIKLLLTDTDSLMYEIRTENVYDDVLKDADMFDTSDYPEDHRCHSNINKKLLA